MTSSSSPPSFLPPTVKELVPLLNLIPHPEGGFFRETFRSGSTPMTSRGQTDYNVPARDLVTTVQRETRRPDQNPQRSCLTSIFWVPTVQSPIVPLTVNLSDHVHYYQGGKPFQYTIYNPTTKTVSHMILGPDLAHGHSMQVPVQGGHWKAGEILKEACPSIPADYTIVAEAVGPGFDYHDFAFIRQAQLEEEIKACSDDNKETKEELEALRRFLHEDQEVEEKHEDFDEHYDDKNPVRKKERM